ncbi:MAG: TRAP transporter small permease [Rhodospirillales bacterium]|nr:TRAP transporter small permease [Rhodospirillales bacterium]
MTALRTWAERAAAIWAFLGGVVLVALALMTVASILGRNLGLGAIPGDFELVGLGAANAFFAGLPWCHARRGHIVVSLTSRWLPRRVTRAMDAVNSVLLAATAALLAWRLAIGGLELKGYNESTMILGVPVWWAFPPIVISLGFLILVGLTHALDDPPETDAP